MTRACWQATPDDRYWLDMVLGTMPFRLVLDTGLTDPLGQVAFDIGATLFDVLEQSGQLLRAGQRHRRDASGRRVKLPLGFVTARLIDPVAHTPMGPPVRCLALRNFAYVTSRVGVVFFHRLIGCRVDWDLDSRTWCVECP